MLFNSLLSFNINYNFSSIFHSIFLIPNLYLDFRFEPYMDLGRPAGTRKIEFSNSSFLVYKQSFKLLKPKTDR